MNKVIMMGRLTRDPETRYSTGENAIAIARFSLAVDRRRKSQDGPEADFFECTAFGKLGEFVEKYLKKGTKILLSGRLENNNYTDKEGQKVRSLRVVAEEIEFAESKNAGGGSVSTPAGSAAPAQEQGFMDMEGLDEGIPFSF